MVDSAEKRNEEMKSEDELESSDNEEPDILQIMDASRDPDQSIDII
jgi:hypothetical protein